MSKHEFDSEDTSRFTLTAFFSFVIVFILLISFSHCHGSKMPTTVNDQTSEPAYK